MNAPAVAVEDISLQLGAFSLHHVCLAVAPGEILALLGPNGAGKSTTLETIAGFHRPSEGRILIAGRDVTRLAPERRGVGLVFQNYGLFPHLTVAANVAFSLGRKGRDHARHPAPDIARLLAQFGIAHLARRRPHDLSPGERQRTALARALAREPALFLFDEPFAALDARTREALRDELGTFLREARIPAIFVTHDQADATALADRVAIMENGAIVQEGPVADVFRAPASSFIADFLGIENRLSARVIGRTGPFWSVAVGERLLHVQVGAATAPANNIFLCIRGEDVTLSHPGSAIEGARPNGQPANHLTMRVVRVVVLGALSKVVLEGAFPLTACLTRRAARDLGLAPGSEAVVEIAPDSIHMLAGA